uniref:Uncharacterized protein n=1 Tax=Aplanochytrium stocchinoi TaxID=215587 RepID=A0A6S8DZ75_9STRA|mmetsp:Transcript_15002/g.19351  ORF Transcript_15002/g.19351 Transcript_15002/m.19351 type:complete len:423 (-) Transcript_15002:860-2128(-)|eukprot:CAMPEP_0204863202 /NCGR_PEP_ID=MMETSP1348-20121228/3133_1 /ASSEMBLY_ACC=CAM_ASM_000700 /TAXON_ID=215587 /ORGANISM="Aplanochytrium stocchinoi, Strain GSBS06" /LENGTH=422 /DNA_ID=CAMNT_0052013457 /DNA_START=111 /DNA_END=1379 /DNA_ORIENTATION=-
MLNAELIIVVTVAILTSGYGLCPSGNSEVTAYTIALTGCVSEPDELQPGCFVDKIPGGSCSAANANYADCNVTLADDLYVSVGACETALPHDWCNQTVIGFITTFCDESCPSGDDLPLFAPLVECLIFETQGKDDAFLDTYRPYDCLLEDPAFDVNKNDVPDICEEDGTFAPFQFCSESIDDVIQKIINETTGQSDLGGSCTELFRGDFLGSLCGMSFSAAIDIFCQQCDELKCKEFFGIRGDIFVYVVAGCGTFLLILISAVFIWRRRRRIMGNHAFFEANPANSGKYALSLPTANTGQNSIQVYKKQLLDFYEQNGWSDPAKKMSPRQQVDHLFQNYDPPKIAVAIKRKYGYVPNGWDSLLDQAGGPSNSPFGSNSRITRQVSNPGTLSPSLSYTSTSPPPGLSGMGRQNSRGSNDSWDL